MNPWSSECRTSPWLPVGWGLPLPKGILLTPMPRSGQGFQECVHGALGKWVLSDLSFQG